MVKVNNWNEMPQTDNVYSLIFFSLIVDIESLRFQIINEYQVGRALIITGDHLGFKKY